MKAWRTSLVLLTLSLVLGPSIAEDRTAVAHWPTWRGPLESGVAPKAKPPLRWSETENVRFKVALPGPGHASPVIWGDRIYLLASIRTERQVEPKAPPPPAEAPTAPSSRLEPPRILLAGGFETPPAPPEPPPAPPAPPTPPTAPAPPGAPQRQRRPPPPKPTHVHQFAVLALARDTGAIVWQRVVREEVPHESGHETASQASASPITDGEHVFAFFGSRGLYCLDKNGNVKWEKDLGDMETRNEFGEGASPALHGDTLVVNWDHEGQSFVVGLDKKTGEERWRVARDERTSWSTPHVIEDGGRALVVVSATKRVRAYDVKTGEDVWQVGGLGPNCIPSPVSAGGLVFVMSGYQEPAGLAIRYGGARGDITDSDRIAWRVDSLTSYVPSPLLYDGKLYFLERFRGVLSAHDFVTGKPLYEPQRIEALGNVYASPVGADGRIYILDRNGKTVVLRHGGPFEVLAENQLQDTFDASPAIADDALYLRGHENLYCLAQAAGG